MIMLFPTLGSRGLLRSLPDMVFSTALRYQVFVTLKCGVLRSAGGYVLRL